MLGLWLNADRQHLRRAYVTGIGVEEGMTQRSQETFAAIYDDDEEAVARFRLYQSRLVAAASRQTNPEATD